MQFAPSEDTHALSRIAPQRYIDIFQGVQKVRTTTTIDGSTHLVDTYHVEWPYGFDRLILDQHGPAYTPEEIEALPADDSEVSACGVTMAWSLDGQTFAELPIDSFRAASRRSSMGNRRSIIASAARRIVASVVRITFPKSDVDLSLRSVIPAADASRSENSKSLIHRADQAEISAGSDPIRVGIIGDSNSVMRYGWVKGLESAGSHVVANVSLGASQMTMIPARIGELEASDPDVVLINSVINEYRPMRYESYNIDVAIDAFSSITAWSAATDSLPIFVIWPHREFLTDVADGPVQHDPRLVYRTWCCRAGIPFIDAYELLYSFSSQRGRSVSQLFLDDNHLLPMVAQRIGTEIAEIIQCYANAVREDTSLIRDVVEWSRPVTYIGIDEWDVIGDENAPDSTSLTTRDVSTTLVSRRMTTIREGESVHIGNADGEVVGVMYNARNSNGAILFRGETRWAMRADFSKFEGEPGYPFITVRSLQRPVNSSNGKLEIRCVPPAPEQQPDELAGERISTIDVSAGEFHRIEIAGLVMRATYTSSLVRRATLPFLDLTASLTNQSTM